MNRLIQRLASYEAGRYERAGAELIISAGLLDANDIHAARLHEEGCELMNTARVMRERYCKETEQ